MTRFRPCIDLHEGRVKQIVGGTLAPDAAPRTNFDAAERPAWYAARYRDDGLTGGHVIKLGPGNDEAAREALAAWPDGLQLGGGVDPSSAQQWLDAGAQKVIVTSWLFPSGTLDADRLMELAAVVPRDRLVIDLSCRRRGADWFVATERWQRVTDVRIDRGLLDRCAVVASELLVHAADVEGLCEGIDAELVARLGQLASVPVTYAGGGRSIADLEHVSDLSEGKVDLTFGSALDLFGGTQVRYADCVAWNRRVLA